MKLIVCIGNTSFEPVNSFHESCESVQAKPRTSVHRTQTSLPNVILYFNYVADLAITDL